MNATHQPVPPTAAGPRLFAGVEAGQGMGEIALAQVGALLIWLHLTALPGLGPVLTVVLCLAAWWRLLGLLRLRGTPLVRDPGVLLAWSCGLGLSGLEALVGTVVALTVVLRSLGGTELEVRGLEQTWFLVLWWVSVASTGLAASSARWLEIGWLRIELRVGQVLILIAPAMLIPVVFGATEQWARILGGCGMGLSLLATFVVRDGMTRVAVALPQDSEMQVPLFRGPAESPIELEREDVPEVHDDERAAAGVAATAQDPIDLEPKRQEAVHKGHLPALPDRPQPPAERDHGQDDVGI